MTTRMLFAFLAIVLTFVRPSSAEKPLSFEGTNGPGKGKHIVFLAADHEYRSEESLPELARILAKHHGFKCTVLFNIDQASGEIVAEDGDSITIQSGALGAPEQKLSRKSIVSSTPLRYPSCRLLC